MSADFGPIDLAKAAPFALGALQVRPATRELSVGGAREVLQPRIMQVLVALGSRGGDVVSRDELIRTCWDGQAVGDDAINRCIAKLRQIGETHGAFEIVTIARVGYRLDARGGGASANRAPAPVLAVLPFENLSSDPEMQFFSDGVSEEILAAAAHIEGVRTIGRASSFQLRGPAKARAAADLRATHVLDGAVRRGGDRVRVSAQLIETAGQTTLWSQSYERSLGDVFAIQDEIAAGVAGALQHAFAPVTQTAIDPIGLDCFLRARSRFRNDDYRANEAVLTLLEEAVERAPKYAPAWALLGRCREMNAMTRTVDKSEARANAIAAVERALALDPGCCEALTAKAQMLPSCGHFAERERLFLKARAAAPGDAAVMHAMSYFLGSVGRSREALAMASQAYETDPLSIQNLQIYTQFLTDERRLDEADALLIEAARRWPDSVTPYMSRLWIAAQRKDWAAVDAMTPPPALAQLLNTAPTLAGRILEGIEVLRDPTAERIGAYRAHVEQYLAETGSVRLGDIVFLSALGERDAAFSLCERASLDRHLRPVETFDPHDIGPVELFSYERGFHDDPRFVGLCARLGHASYWVQTGNWPDCADTVPYDFRDACRRALNEGGA